MRLTSELNVSGNACIGLLTGQVKLLTFLLTASRNTTAALRFFHKTFRRIGAPEVVTIDNSTASRVAPTVLSNDKNDKAEEETLTIRQSNYLNNLMEQDNQ